MIDGVFSLISFKFVFLFLFTFFCFFFFCFARSKVLLRTVLHRLSLRVISSSPSLCVRISFRPWRAHVPHPCRSVSTLNLDCRDVCQRYRLLVLVDVGPTVDRIPDGAV